MPDGLHLPAGFSLLDHLFGWLGHSSLPLLFDTSPQLAAHFGCWAGGTGFEFHRVGHNNPYNFDYFLRVKKKGTEIGNVVHLETQIYGIRCGE